MFGTRCLYQDICNGRSLSGFYRSLWPAADGVFRAEGGLSQSTRTSEEPFFLITVLSPGRYTPNMVSLEVQDTHQTAHYLAHR